MLLGKRRARLDRRLAIAHIVGCADRKNSQRLLLALGIAHSAASRRRWLNVVGVREPVPGAVASDMLGLHGRG